jgi:hypothetical protein
MAAMARREKAPRERNRGAWWGAGVFALGLVVFVIAVAPLGLALLRAGSDEVDVPGTTTRRLESGDYLVMPHIATSDQYGPVNITRGAAVPRMQVVVTGADGAVELTPDTSTTMNLNGDQYGSVARFTIETDAEYTITSESSSPTTMLVIRDPFAGIAPRLFGAGVGVAIALAGGVWWLVALIRGGRTRRSATLPPPPLPPPPATAL